MCALGSARLLFLCSLVFVACLFVCSCVCLLVHVDFACLCIRVSFGGNCLPIAPGHREGLIAWILKAGKSSVGVAFGGAWFT